MVYSNYGLARAKAYDWVDRLERDLFICHVKYPSGEEFVLKDRIPKGFCYLDKIELPFHHKFENQKNAIREAYKFENDMGVPVMVDRKTITKNGYKQTSHYILCLT